MQFDRDFLFGILGLRVQFVTRDALVAATSRLSAEQPRRLPELLQAQGALSPQQAGLLDALTEEHLRLFDGDPRRSLAALGVQIENSGADWPSPTAPPKREPGWTRRHPRLTFGIVAGVVGLLLAAGVTADLFRQNRRAAADALQAEAHARHQAENLSYRAISTLGRQVHSAYFRLGHDPNTRLLRKELLQASEEKLETLLRGADDLGIRDRKLVHTHLDLAEILTDQGQSVRAGEQLQRAHRLARQLVEDDPKDGVARFTLAETCDMLGDHAHDLGQTDEAIRWYCDGLAALEGLERRHPGHVPLMKCLADTHQKLGAVHWEEESTRRAFDHFRQSLAAYERLHALDPDNNAVEQKLVHCRESLAIAAHGLRQPDARQMLDRALATATEAAAKHPDQWGARRNLGRALANRARLEPLPGGTEQALARLRESLAVLEPLAAEHPLNAAVQDTLTESYLLRDSVLSSTGRTQEAADAIGKALAVELRLTEHLAVTPERLRKLLTLHARLGSLRLALDRLDDAEVSFREAACLAERLDRAGDPGDCVACYTNLGATERRQGSFKEATRSFTKAREFLAAAQQEGEPGGSVRADLEWIDAQRKLCQNCDRALADFGFVRMLSAEEAAQVLETLLEAYARRRDRAVLVATAEELSRLPEHRYLAACAWSEASRAAAEEVALREQYAGKAIEILGSIPTGEGNPSGERKELQELLRRDPRLDPLREREDFKKLVGK